MMKSDPKSVWYAARRRSIAIVQVAVAVLLLFFSKFVQCMSLFMARSCRLPRCNNSSAIRGDPEASGATLAPPLLPSRRGELPSRSGELHPEPLTEPDLGLSTYPARATH